MLLDSKQKRHYLVGPSELWKLKREFQIKFLKQMGLKPHNYFLDVGCGTLRGGIPIIEYLEKNHYVGIDVRSNVLKEAKKELSESKLTEKEPILVNSDSLSSVNLKRSFDYIWAFSVFFHLTDEKLQDCLMFVKNHLKDDGVFFANVNIGNRKSGQWQGFPVVWRSIDFYKKQASSFGLKIEDIGTLEKFGHQTNSEQDYQRILKITQK